MLCLHRDMDRHQLWDMGLRRRSVKLDMGPHRQHQAAMVTSRLQCLLRVMARSSRVQATMHILKELAMSNQALITSSKVGEVHRLTSISTSS